MAGEFVPVIGREVLKPGPAAKVLARFADGSAAVTCNIFGKGKAYVVGFFPGLEYSAAVRGERFDMTRDFDAVRRSFVTAPALEHVRPVVDASLPTVEGVLLRNDATGARAVTLMNWAYRIASLRKRGERISGVVAIAPAENVTVRVRGAGAVRGVRSALRNEPLKFEAAGGMLTIHLPHLDEGDVLLLE